jgi:SAM-dependent methyltransferase
MNSFSPKWFQTFSDGIPADQTKIECDFARRHMPRQLFGRILDLCCGSGRHARILTDRGYEVVGVDSNAEALRAAAERVPDATIRLLDLQSIAELDGPFDGCINLWHSFGYFSDETNARILRDLTGLLRPGGRFVIDLYNRSHHERLDLEESSVRNGEAIRTKRSWEGGRLRVELAYEHGGSDVFEWRLYDEHEFRELADSCGFRTVLSCAWFDENIPVSAEHARMQFVFER